MVKRNIRQIIGVVMAAVFLATIAGSAGASAASGGLCCLAPNAGSGEQYAAGKRLAIRDHGANRTRAGL